MGSKWEIIHSRHLGVQKSSLVWRLGDTLCRIVVPSLLCHGQGDLGVAGAGALGARLDGEGEHEAVAGSCVGGHDESGAYRAFLPRRQILDACIARWVYGHIPMCIEAPVVGVDDGRCKVDTLAGCGVAVGRDLDNMCRMRSGCRRMGAPLRARRSAPVARAVPSRSTTPSRRPRTSSQSIPAPVRSRADRHPIIPARNARHAPEWEDHPDPM